jgi:putative transposase
MPRKPRLFNPEIPYHIIARGNNRQTLFHDSTDYQHFLFCLEKLKSEHTFDLYHYCLMPNHIHLLMKFGSLIDFQKISQRMLLLYAKHFSRRYTHIGHVFQDRFKSIPVEENSYLLECGRYIERNPLKAGMVQHPADYPWSSASFYLRSKRNQLLKKNPLYENLSGQNQLRTQLYENYVVQNRPYEEAIETAIFGKYLSVLKVSP